MSNREKCVALLDDFTETQLVNVAVVLQAMRQTVKDALADHVPNAETVAAIRELENGGGELWTGSTEDFFSMLLSGDKTSA